MILNFYLLLVLISRQMEVTESLMNKDSSLHALSVLGDISSMKQPEKSHGSVKSGEGSASSGTYAKTC